jgi:hypothetical protein
VSLQLLAALDVAAHMVREAPKAERFRVSHLLRLAPPPSAASAPLHTKRKTPPARVRGAAFSISCVC